MAKGNPVLELLESDKATLEDAVEAINIFERELAAHRVIETNTCQFCGKPYVVQPGDKPVVAEQGRRSVCWRPACRQELRARGLKWAGHHLYQGRPESRPHDKGLRGR